MPGTRNAPKLWPALPVERGSDRSLAQARVAEARRDGAGDRRAVGAVRVANRSREDHRTGRRRGGERFLGDERGRGRRRGPAAPTVAAAARRPGAATRSQAPAGLDRDSARGRSRSARPTRSSSRVRPSDASSVRVSSGDQPEVAHEHLGRAGELRPQVLALRRDAGGAGVQVALARHHAADRDERRGAEPVLLGAERGGDRHVASRLEAAVGLQHDARPQSLPRQHLLRLGDAELPRQPRRA